MKKIISITLIAVAFFSCQTDVKFNEQYFEGQRDGIFWRSTNTTATVNTAGQLTLTGYVDLETLTLKTAATTKAIYLLGTSNTSNFASFISSENKLYTTNLISGTAPVSKITLTNPGNSYSVATGVATTAITGTGTGLKVDIVKTTSSGSISSVIINSTGTGYAAGDIVSIYNGSLTGIATVVIQNVNSNGEVEITDYSNGTVSGSFKLNASNATNTGIVNFQYGKFYKIPVTKVP
jgi:hypothetical protein